MKNAVPDEIITFFMEHDLSGKRILLISVGDEAEAGGKEGIFQFITGNQRVGKILTVTKADRETLQEKMTGWLKEASIIEDGKV